MESVGNEFSQIDVIEGKGVIENARHAPYDTTDRPEPSVASVSHRTTSTMNATTPTRSSTGLIRKRRSLWFQNITSSVGYKNVKQCYVMDNPLVALRWNTTAKRYQVVPNPPPKSSNTTSQNITATRLLGSHRLERRDEEQTLAQPAIDSSQFFGGNETGVVVYGRACDCVSDLLPSARPYYCPEFVPVCHVLLGRATATSGSGAATPIVTVTCSSGTSTLYAKYLFPMSLFFFIVYVFLCLCSPKGLAARMYGRKRVCRRLKERDDRFEAGLQDELEWMLQRQRSRHEIAMAQRRQQMERQSAQWPPPSPLGTVQGSSRGSGAAQQPASQQQQQRHLERVLMPGSTPFSALLLEMSNRQQQRRQQEVELVPMGAPVEQPATALAHGPPPPLAHASSSTMVLLKTRLYDGAASTAADDDNNIATSADTSTSGGDHSNNADESGRGRGDGCTCSICLTDLAVGDRVGDLPCKHLFHTTCLKDWIKRRHRRCPLCMAVIPLVPKPQQPIVPQQLPEAVLVLAVEPPPTSSPPVPAGSIT